MSGERIEGGVMVSKFRNGVLAIALVSVLTVQPVGAQPGVPDVAAKAGAVTPEVIARGRYMVVTGHCNNCHTADYQRNAGQVPDKDWLTGRDIGHRGPWGTTYAANLRINANKMTEAEWVAYASTLRNRPGMPTWSLRDTTPEDIRAMYHFIRSLGPVGEPSRASLPPGEEPKTPHIRVVVGPKAPPAPRVESEPQQPTVAPSSSYSVEALARGRYMLVTGHCNNCHTEGYGEREGKVPERDWLKGSNRGHRGSWGTIYATNVRINVAAMTESQWITYMRAARPRAPMPWWAVHETTVEDVRAMYQFIRTLGPPGDPAPALIPPDREPQPPYTHWPDGIFKN
jgi:mono/diheme cytochrome c family protein